MKKVTTTLTVLLLLTISAFSKTVMSASSKMGKDNIVIQFIAKDTSIEAALVSAKNALLKSKFIALDCIQRTSFTATRTTVSPADYYVADVTASKTEHKVNIIITFVRVGTGLLNLKKVAEEIKVALES